jgi:polar amino acid transport system substrate-binding protein
VSVPGNWTAWDDARTVLKFIERGSLDYTRLITHRFPAADAEKAYSLLRSDSAALAVILEWLRGE